MRATDEMANLLVKHAKLAFKSTVSDDKAFIFLKATLIDLIYMNPKDYRLRQTLDWLMLESLKQRRTARPNKSDPYSRLLGRLSGPGGIWTHEPGVPSDSKKSSPEESENL